MWLCDSLQRLLGDFDSSKLNVKPTWGVSFGLPQGGGYPINPYGGNPLGNPYPGYAGGNGLNLGLVSVNPLVSVQVQKDEYGDKVIKPFVNLHVTPNQGLVNKLGDILAHKKQALLGHGHYHGHYPSHHHGPITYEKPYYHEKPQHHYHHHDHHNSPNWSGHHESYPSYPSYTGHHGHYGSNYPDHYGHYGGNYAGNYGNYNGYYRNDEDYDYSDFVFQQ